MSEGPPNGRGNDTAPQQILLAQTIANHMRDGGALDNEAWSRFENFVSEKARQWRSAQLKRGHEEVPPAQASESSARKILKIRKRK